MNRRDASTPAATATSDAGAAARLGRSDALLALALGGALLALYGATLQDRLYGDGPALLRLLAHAPDGGPNTYHALYLPIARVWNALLGFDLPARALLWLSASSGALAASGTFVLARLLGAPRAAALFGAALFALAPATWFFATAIELHTVHAACVALVAIAVLALPFERPGLAVPLAAAATLPVFLTHQSGALLQPAFALLALLRWRASARPPTAARALGVLAPAFAAALAVAIGIGSLVAAPTPGSNGESEGLLAFVSSTQRFASPGTYWDMWGWPLAGTWLLVAAALAEPHTRRRLGSVVALAALPQLAFFTFLGVPERGAYALGFLPLVAAAGACALGRFGAGAREHGSREMGPGEHGAAPSSSVRAERRVAHAVPPAALAAGALVLVGQGLLARASIRAFDDGSFGPAQRARGEHVRALGDGTVVLISFQVEPQIVETTHPELFEFVLLDVLEAQARAGVPPEQVADLFAAVVGPAVAAPATTVVLDRGYVAREAGHPATAPYFRAIEARAALLARVESRPLGERDYWLLRPLASPSDDAGVR